MGEDTAASDMHDKIKAEVDGKEVELDSAFFLETVVFLVNGCLFKVPKRNLQEQSKVFQNMFSVPSGGQEPGGSSISNPIRLDGISKEDFRTFLRILCPRWLNENVALTTDQWISILRLSHMCSFQNIRTSAIKILDVLLKDDSPIAWITLGRECEVSAWRFKSYYILASRKMPLTVREGQKLGVDDVVRLGFGREMRLEEKNWLSRWEEIGSVVTEGKAHRTEAEKLLENKTIDLIVEVFNFKISREGDNIQVQK